MTQSLANTTAIVTGASRGIGRLIAIALAAEGAKVAVVARTSGAKAKVGTIEHVAAEIETRVGIALPVQCDITREEAVKSMVRRVHKAWGRIDLLVNNAAIYPRTDFLDLSPDDWRTGLEINLTGPFLCCKAVVPHMIAQGGGSIVNIGSASGSWSTLEGQVMYATAKAGLTRFSTALAMELRRHNVAVNCLDPGAVRTEGVVEYVLKGGAEPLEQKGYYWYPPEPQVIGPSLVHLAKQRGAFSGHVLRRYDYGKTWGEGIAPPKSALDEDVSRLRASRERNEPSL